MVAVIVTVRDLHFDPDRDAEFLPITWERIRIPNPLKVTDGEGQSRPPEHDPRECFEICNHYEMGREVREWCREQFGYEPLLYAHHDYEDDRPRAGGSFTTTYSTVFTDYRHAVAFMLRWR